MYDDKPVHWSHALLIATATAVLTTLGTELGKWVVDEFKAKREESKKKTT